MHYEITYQPEKRAARGDSLEELRAALSGIEHESSVQVRLRTFDGESFSAYFNAQRAWVMWMNEHGCWALPQNPGVDEDEMRQGEPRESCFIENGQLDEYSITSSTPRVEAVRMLLHFFESGQRPPWIRWVGDFWAGDL